MIGSSILRGAISQKLCKKIYVFEKNIKYQKQIKKINKKIILIKKIDKKIENIDLVIISTPMSEYQKIIIKLNKNLSNHSLITDVGSTRGNVAKLIKEKLSKKLNWVMSHPISGSEASGPKFGNKNLFKLLIMFLYSLIGVEITNKSISFIFSSSSLIKIIFLFIFFICFW